MDPNSFTQPHEQDGPQGDHQVQVVPLHQQIQDDEQQQNVASVQAVQAEGFQQPGQAAPLPSLEEGGQPLLPGQKVGKAYGRAFSRLLGPLRGALLLDAGIGRVLWDITVIHTPPPSHPGSPGPPGPPW